LSAERDTQLEELRSLIDNIGHIREIVSTQQSFAQTRGTTEPVNLTELMEDALKINDAGLIRHNVNVVREFGEVPPIVTERHQVLQIIVNLISNARYALSDCDQDNRTMTLIVTGGEENVLIEVRDNGVGIAHDNLTNIFSHGFTTREDGHGFGLHSSALSAQEVGGSLSVDSDGVGQGATFTLRIPIEKEALCRV
ncbi:MAG: ATP-binding protein, partial [Pirellulaceae bacterium]|nr:ATP-binding protein [Pirellulaceae bacterium]